MTVRPTEAKSDEIRKLCTLLSGLQKPKIKEVASVVGKLVAAFPVVQYCPFHYQELEKEQIFALKVNRGNYDATITLS